MKKAITPLTRQELREILAQDMPGWELVPTITELREMFLGIKTPAPEIKLIDDTQTVKVTCAGLPGEKMVIFSPSKKKIIGAQG